MIAVALLRSAAALRAAAFSLFFFRREVFISLFFFLFSFFCREILRLGPVHTP